MAVCLQLGIDGLAVNQHFKPATIGGNQPDCLNFWFELL